MCKLLIIRVPVYFSGFLFLRNEPFQLEKKIEKKNLLSSAVIVIKSNILSSIAS